VDCDTERRASLCTSSFFGAPQPKWGIKRSWYPSVCLSYASSSKTLRFRRMVGCYKNANRKPMLEVEPTGKRGHVHGRKEGQRVRTTPCGGRSFGELYVKFGTHYPCPRAVDTGSVYRALVVTKDARVHCSAVTCAFVERSERHRHALVRYNTDALNFPPG